jgi:hypothetical protein
MSRTRGSERIDVVPTADVADAVGAAGGARSWNGRKGAFLVGGGGARRDRSCSATAARRENVFMHHKHANASTYAPNRPETATSTLPGRPGMGIATQCEGTSSDGGTASSNEEVAVASSSPCAVGVAA